MNQREWDALRERVRLAMLREVVKHPAYVGIDLTNVTQLLALQILQGTVTTVAEAEQLGRAIKANIQQRLAGTLP